MSMTWGPISCKVYEKLQNLRLHQGFDIPQEVRKCIVASLIVTSTTLPEIINRSRDVDDDVSPPPSCQVPLREVYDIWDSRTFHVWNQLIFCGGRISTFEHINSVLYIRCKCLMQ